MVVLVVLGSLGGAVGARVGDMGKKVVKITSSGIRGHVQLRGV